MASTAQIEELFALGKIVFILSITLVIWAWLAVGLRLWVRFRITKSPGWDDAAMVATLVSRIFLTANITDSGSCSSLHTAPSS
jgi:hypothetical protein